MAAQPAVVRLLLSLIVTVALHAMLVPVTVLGLMGNVWGAFDLASPDPADAAARERLLPELAEPQPEKVESEQPEKPKQTIRFGKDDAPDRLTASWIAHEDLQRLIARQSAVDQPALQRRADPRPNAPARLDPVPAADNLASRPTPPSASPIALVEKVRPEPDRQTKAARFGQDGQTSPASTAVVPTPPKPADVDGIRQPRPSAQPAVTATDSSQNPPVRPVDGQIDPAAVPANRLAKTPTDQKTKPQDATAKPTSAALTDREASPSVTIDGGRLRPGRVVVGKGIEIKTVAPRFGIASRLSAVPDNPRVLVVFNRKGRVIEARLIRSSGHAGVDGPILSSLYRWRATGDLLKDLDDELKFEVKLLLR